MKIAPTRKYAMSLESVAMTDIVMNMFIFFFISFSLLYTFNPSKTKHIKVNLPKARNVTQQQGRDTARTITLSREGPIYLDDEIVTMKELETKLSSFLKNNPGLKVVVDVDRQVTFKNVVQVLDVLNGLGIERLRISALEEEK